MKSNYSQSKQNQQKDQQGSAQECKKIMTEKIIQEIQNLQLDETNKIKKKNQDSLKKYTAESEQNYLEFKKLVETLKKEVIEYAQVILDCPKIDKKTKVYAENLQQQSSEHLKKLQEILRTKNVNIYVNQFFSNRHIYILQRINKSKKDIEALMKAGCCGGSQQKQALSVDVPENFYLCLHFLEFLSQTQACPPKVEYPQLDADFDSFQFRIQELIDKYFPTDTEVKFVEIEKEVIKKEVEIRQVEIPKVEYIKVDSKQDDLVGKGHEYVYGIGTPQQVKRGLELYKQEAKGNNCRAFNSLGQVYFEGKVVEQDLNQAYDYYLKAANLGDLEGIYQIGQFYERGYISKVTNKEYSQDELIKSAIEQYKKASQNRNKDTLHQNAIVDLGYFYENGVRDSNGNFIIVQNIQEASKLYECVDKQNCPRALNNLGTLCLKNNQKERALRNFEEADKLGYPAATMNLGICYLKGIAVHADINKAMRLLKKAAKKGNQESKLQYCYYLLQQASDENNEQEYFQAATYLREILTTQPQNSDALLYLGFLHELGLGVTPDYKTSLKYYFQSAELNNDKALTKLGDIYFSGALLPKNVPKAIYYYEKAASFGNSTALINLGAIYEEGYDGNLPDYDKAYELYLQAANNGSAEAWTHIGLMIEMGRKKDCKASDGYQAYLKASQLGDINSIQILKDKVDILQNNEINLQFQNDEEEEQFRILRQNQLQILQSHRQISELQQINQSKATKVQENYDTPTAIGLNYQNWENQNLQNFKK
ncbi:hypothetical protein ABPG74_005853 [Tetrahymena malaccensis]